MSTKLNIVCIYGDLTLPDMANSGGFLTLCQKKTITLYGFGGFRINKGAGFLHHFSSLFLHYIEKYYIFLHHIKKYYEN